MELTDKTLVCKNCGKEFVHTVGAQEFFIKMGFTNEPKLCKECKEAKKSSQSKFDNKRFENNND